MEAKKQIWGVGENMGIANKVYGKFSSRYPFSKMIRCGCCGAFYVRNSNMRSKGGHIAAWCCSNHFEDSSACPQKGISDESIKRAFVKVINEVAENMDKIRVLVKASMKEAITDNPKDSADQIELEIIKLQEEMLELHKKKTKGLVDPREYATKGQELAERIDLKKKRLEEVKSKAILSEIMSRRMEDISKIVDSLKPTDEFDEVTFRQMVESITISERTKITFKFKIGIEKTIEAEVK